MAISPDGRWLASGGTFSRRALLILPLRRSLDALVKLDTDDEFLAHDQTIKLWNLSTGACEKTLTGHHASIYSLSFSAESTLLISGSGDGTVRVWDVLASPAVGGTTGTVVLGGRKKGDKEKKGKAGAVDGNTSFVFLPSLLHTISTSAIAYALPPLLALAVSRQETDESKFYSQDLLVTLATKRTPIIAVRFTPRNLCLAAGAIDSS